MRFILRVLWSSWRSSSVAATRVALIAIVAAVAIVAVVAGCGEARPPAEDQDAGEQRGTTLFLEPCTTNEECETGLCFQFNARGRMCSKTCGSASDCPPPSSGCNMMGVCKHSL